jgi:aryl-alcohol dehydrogenase-like predicted oxidoreductase
MAAVGIDRLILGTAQLGQRYGLTASGEPTDEGAFAILDAAWAAGIRAVDTAQAYGRSEELVGAWSAGSGRSPHVTTKLDASIDPTDAAAVAGAARASGDRLGRSPDLILVHDPDAAGRWANGVGDALAASVQDGLAGAAGVSVYGADEAVRLSVLPLVSAVQVNFSVLDHRLLEEAEHLGGAELQVRSVFLQGLLTLERERLPAELRRLAATQLDAWDEVCAAAGERPARLALRFALTVLPDARVVVGADDSGQVQELARSASAGPLPADLIEAVLAIPSAPVEVIDPRLWPAG